MGMNVPVSRIMECDLWLARLTTSGLAWLVGFGYDGIKRRIWIIVFPQSTSFVTTLLLNGRSASWVTEQPGTAHKRPDGPDHRIIRWIDLTWSVRHHSNTVQL